MTTPKPLRVIGVTTENVGKLRAIQLRPKPTGITVLTGPNKAGKSTAILAMQAVLEGAKALPQCPIRFGQTKAQTTMELGESPDKPPDYIVRQTITEEGAKLVVTSADGAKYPSPAKLLAGMVNHIAFDPGEFARAKPEEQDKILKGLVGLDFTELDRQRTALYDLRTTANREAKALEARVAAAPHYPEAPSQETVVAELLAELQGLQDTLQVNAEARREVQTMQRGAQSAKETVARCDLDIARIRAELVKAEERRALCLTRQEEAQATADKAAKEAEELQDPDVEPLTAKIKGADEMNRQVRANAAKAALEKELAEKQAKAAKFTGEIEAIDADKQSQIASAKFPIPGLGFSDFGPTLAGPDGVAIPIAQASESQKLIIGAAIGLALHPRIRTMWIDRGSGIDDETLDALEAYAEEQEAQFIIEMVRTNDPAAIEIRDGSVVEKEVAKPAAE